MRIRARYLLSAACLVVATVFFQNCGGFSTGLISSQLASVGIRADGCSQAARLFGGKCRVVNTISLSGSSVTTKTFPDFQKFVYSVAIPSAVNFAGMTGTVALDSNSPSFTEALYTVGYSPSGSCPASGSAFPDYDSVFATMPDNKFINQYIVKAQGGHVEMPAVYNADYPVAVSGCFFVILDGSAGLAGTSDTMSVNLQLNVIGGDPVAANVMLGLTNYEHFAQPGKPFSSTNQYLEVNKISKPIHVSALVGDVSNAAFDFFSLAPPTGAWNTHNTIFLVRQCGSYTAGTFQDQDFYSQVPQNAITLYDFSGSSSDRGVVQTSIYQPLDLDLHAGDCIVHIIAGNANGALDFEDALAFNGAQGSNHPVLGNIDGIAVGDITGWACQQGVADSINIELYLGGVDYGTYSASQASEPAVAAACSSTGTAYRFTIEIAGDIATNYAGKAVTIYGLSSNAANNNALSNSAVFKIPGATTTTAAATPSPADVASAAATTAAAQAAASAAAQQAAATAAAQAAASAAAQAASAATTAAAPAAPSSIAVSPYNDTSGQALNSSSSYAIVSVASGKCLDVTGARVASGVRIQQYDCLGGANQQWRVVANGDGSFSFISVNSGLTLDFDANTLPANGSIVQQWVANGGANQNFNLSPSNGGYQLQSMSAPGECLDLPAQALNANGVKYQTYSCSGANNQAFTFVRQ